MTAITNITKGAGRLMTNEATSNGGETYSVFGLGAVGGFALKTAIDLFRHKKGLSPLFVGRKEKEDQSIF